MIALKTVLCPVDFSPATPRQVDLAAELSRTFGARLVLHHNRHSMGTVASVGWMWNAAHHGDSQVVVDAKLRDCLARLPEGVRSLCADGVNGDCRSGVPIVWVQRRRTVARTVS